MAEWWATFVQQASGGSRTDVLRALVWPNALLLAALIGAVSTKSPVSVLILLGALLILFMGIITLT